MSVETANILSVELDDPLDEAGFRHVAASLGSRLGARRIGASVYRAEASAPIWPYHYPESGHWLLRNGPGREELVVREAGPVGES